MEFSGPQLSAILERQAPAVAVFNLAGVCTGEVAPGMAAKIATEGRYVGIGHKKRIRYIRPAQCGLWHGHRTTERLRGEGGQIIAPPWIQKHVADRL